MQYYRDSHVMKSNKENGEPSSSWRLELLPLEGAKGAVWAFFGFQSKDGVFVEKDKRKRDTVYCKLCFQSMKYCGNTTNLHFHLRSKHLTEY